MKRFISIPFIFLGIILGILFPYGRYIKWSIPYILAFILYLGFLKIEIKIKDFKRKEILLTAITSTLIMPFLAYFIFKSSFILDYRIGLFLLAITPTAFALTAWIGFLPFGDKKTVIAVLIVMVMISIIYIPVLFYVFFKTHIKIDIPNLVLKLILLIFIPLILAKITKKCINNEKLKKTDRYSKYVNLFVLFLIIYVSIGSAHSKLTFNISILYLLLAVYALLAMQGIVAYLFAVIFKVKHKSTYLIMNISKNTQLAIIIALMNFGELAAIPCIVGIIGHNSINSVLMILFHVNNKAKTKQKLD